MNQLMAKWITLVFLSALFLYHGAYIISHFNNRKISKKWLWFRAAFCVLTLASVGGFIYVFFISA